MKPVAGTPIVVGVDDTPESLLAVDWAAHEAAARHQPLQILHAFIWPLLHVPLGPAPEGPPEGGFRNAAEHIVAGAVARARAAQPGLTVTTVTPEAAPAAALIAQSRRASLVVLGHRGLDRVTGLLVGSIAVRVAAHTRCPVVVVPPTRPSEEPTDIRVVAAIDGSSDSHAALAFAFDHASFHGARLVAIHAYHWPTSTGPGDMLPLVFDPAVLRGEEERVVAEALAGWCEKYPDVAVERRILWGNPPSVLAKESAGALLTVVGSRGRGGLTGLLLGSVSQHLLTDAQGPVAVVRANLH
jgi:nucleotide-binding universal stress UspA family protein